MDTEYIRKLIRKPESETLEFKRNFCSSEKSILIKQIAAMANTEGGYIVIGVDEEKGAVGTNCIVTKKTLLTGLHPRPNIRLSETEVDGKRLVIIGIDKSNVPILYQGAWYVKKGDAVKIADYADIRKQNDDYYVNILTEMNNSIQLLQKRMADNDKASKRSTISWSIISAALSSLVSVIVTIIAA